MRVLAAVLLFGLSGWAQEAPRATPPAASAAPNEDQQLSDAIGEAANSPVDFIRALEKHLAKFPNTSRRNEIERALVKSAIEAKDNKRLIEYGERVLAREPDDIQILDKIVRALLVTDAPEASERALKYTKHYEKLLHETRNSPPPGHVSESQWHEEVDKGLGRVLACEARATGNLGKIAEAIALAQRGYDTYPAAESAREIGRWLVKAGKAPDAIAPYADAFAIPDARNTDADRTKDRALLGDLYRKLYGSEKGLGDIILEAYDRTTGLLAARSLRLRQNDPNAQATNITEVTVSGVDGGKLAIGSLKGKTVVFDFWATWCGPCRAQHPLYEEVKERFRNSPDVVFLSIATDEDHDLVAPFLKENQWGQKVYFEDGLSRVLTINSIPTTIVLDRKGEVVSRMNGYVPGRFVDMLSNRIRDAQKD